jgi:hypothetical protein
MRAVRSRMPWIAAATVVTAALALGGVVSSTPAGVAGPGALAKRFFGPSMVRAEVVLKVDGEVRDYRLDRGRIRMARDGVIVLFERDRTLVSVPISPSTTILLNNQPVAESSLRRGMQALTIRQGDGPAETVVAFTRR